MALSEPEKDGSDPSTPDGDIQHSPPPPWQPGTEKYDIEHMSDKEGQRRLSIAEGEVKHNKLGWVRLTICLIVEAIALGKPLEFRYPNRCRIRR